MEEAPVNDSYVVSWMKVAYEKQLFYYECLGKKKWELYEPNDLRYLHLKIGFALFGPPQTSKEKVIGRDYTLPDQKERIDRVMKAVTRIATGSLIYISFIYVIVLIRLKYSELPIVRVLKERGKGKDVYFFIDPLGNTYEGFEKFLETNLMPSCIACYPRNGFYSCELSGELQLDYFFVREKSSSPFSESNELDNSGICLQESFIKGVSEETNGCRFEIRSPGDQFSSINAIHSSYLHFLHCIESTRITPLIAKALEIGQIRTNWSAVINMIPQMIKYSQGIDSTHIAQLHLSILFFCHTIVSENVLEEILTETFNKLTKPTISCTNFTAKKCITDIDGNHEEVRLIKRINGKDKLFKEIVNIEATENVEEKENYRIENLLEVLKAVTKANNRLDILTNYCLFLQELNNNCKQCCEETNHLKEDILFDDDEKLKLSELENSRMRQAKKSNMCNKDMNSNGRILNLAVGTRNFVFNVLDAGNEITYQIASGTGSLLLGLLQSLPGQIVDHGLGKMIELILKV